MLGIPGMSELGVTEQRYKAVQGGDCGGRTLTEAAMDSLVIRGEFNVYASWTWCP
jgi:hypothetical protein